LSRSARSALVCLALAAATPLGAWAEATPAGGGSTSQAASTPSRDSQASQTASTKDSASAWVIGFCRLSLAGEGKEASTLQTAVPLLAISELKSLPTRIASPAEAEEAIRVKAAQARFSAGADLAAKLDSRAASFLDPSADRAEKSYNLKTADKAIADSAGKLDRVVRSDAKSLGATGSGGGGELEVRLWSGHAKGMLIEPPGSEVAKAAKAAGVDLLVSGSVSSVAPGYASVTLRGYSATLGRDVYSYTSHCSIDDPEPLAREVADQVERLSAGRQYTRIEIEPYPPDSELYVNGRTVADGARVAYVYRPGLVRIVAEAPGYDPGSEELLVGNGERRTVEIRLKARSTGQVAVDTSPSGASLSLDSVPLGPSPTVIGLDGTRRILTATEDGMEGQTVVLPASGDSAVDVKLQPSDGLGPGGRIEVAKDKFYWAFGWFALSVPITTLTFGIYNGYDEAYQRSGSPSLAYSRWNAQRAVVAACTLTAATAVFMAIRLVKYLKTAQ